MSFEILVSLSAIIGLIAIAAILSGIEAAFLSASNARLKSLEREGKKRATLVNALKGRMEKLISTLMLTNNLVNIWATAIATGVFISLFGDAGETIATMVMTISIVVFAELLPKFYAIRQAETVAMALAPVINFLIRLFGPFASLVELISRRILKLLGVPTDNMQNVTSSLEELRGAIDLHPGLDQETSESRAMLHSILDLGDVSVEEVLIHRKDVKMINLDDPIEKINQQIIESHHTRLPIWQGDLDRIIGIVHTKDFLRLTSAHPGKAPDKQDLLSIAKQPWFIPETATLFEQLQAFRKRREHMALVVDEYGSFQGIVTLEDIIEEIVGHIDDEHDPLMTGLWQTKGGEIYVVGSMTIRDLNRQMGWQLPDEDASTVAGLIMLETRTIPEKDQVFDIQGYRVKILRRVKHHISLVKITKTPRAQA